MWAIAAAWIAESRRAALDEARRELASVTRMLAEHTDRAVQTVDLILQTVVWRLERLTAGERARQAILDAILRDQLAGVPQARAMLVLDRDGRSIADSAQTPPRAFNGADREYFAVHGRDRDGGLFIGPPVQSRINGLWAISVSRRLSDPDGGFAGVVVIALDPAYFSGLYAAVAPAEDATVSLFGRDRVLRARHPATDAPLGAPAGPAALEDELRRAGAGTYRAPPDAGRDERIVGFAAARSYPLVVVADRRAASVDRAWYGAAASAALAAAAISVLLAFLFANLHRHARYRDRVAVRLVRARKRAERAERAKARFLAGMSHELRTPLNAVMGFASLLEHPRLGAEEARRLSYAGYIRDAGRHLLELVDDLLDQAAIAAGRLRFHPERVDPNEILRDALRMVETRAAAGGVTLALESREPRLRLEADPRRLRQVAVNLLSNAVKFTPRGGAVRAVCAPTAAGGAELIVADSGIGMNEAELAEAFRPFHRVDNAITRAREGTGLGLPIAKALVELHGAKLDVASAPGRGTTVTVTFPVAELAPAAPTAESLAA